MKITLKKLYEAYSVLRTLYNQNLPIKVSYNINRTIKNIESDVKFFSEKQFEIYSKYLETDDKGNFIVLTQNNDIVSYKTKEGKVKELQEELDILNNMECEVEVYKINLDTLLNSNISLSPASFEVLDFIIE